MENLYSIDFQRAIRAMSVITANENGIWFTRTSIGQMEQKARNKIVEENRRNAENYERSNKQAMSAEDLAKIFAGINDG